MRRSGPESVAESRVSRSSQTSHGRTGIDDDATVAGRIELEECGGNATDSDSADADSDKFNVIKRL